VVTRQSMNSPEHNISHNIHDIELICRGFIVRTPCVPLVTERRDD
jgi:hypothetical protein